MSIFLDFYSSPRSRAPSSLSLFTSKQTQHIVCRRSKPETPLIKLKQKVSKPIYPFKADFIQVSVKLRKQTQFRPVTPPFNQYINPDVLPNFQNRRALLQFLIHTNKLDLNSLTNPTCRQTNQRKNKYINLSSHPPQQTAVIKNTCF